MLTGTVKATVIELLPFVIVIPVPGVNVPRAGATPVPPIKIWPFVAVAVETIDKELST